MSVVNFHHRDTGGTEKFLDTTDTYSVIVREAVGERVKKGSRLPLPPFSVSLWSVKGARVLAAFDHGAPAITANKFGKGTAIAVLPDAWSAAHAMPELLRDVLDYAITLQGHKPLVDVKGSSDETDLAVAETPDGVGVAIVNYKRQEIEVQLTPLAKIRSRKWFDLTTNTTLTGDRRLKLKVPAHGFRAVEYRQVKN